jgi:tetratricopeptide (TPR) repeat protein
VRKIILIAGLVASSGNIASAGMPYFNSSAQAAPPTAQDSGGWKFPRLWGKKDASPEPQFFYQQPTAPPSTTERFSAAMTNNAAVNTARDWMTPDANAVAPKRPDAISLSQPTGNPTPALMVSLAQVREKQGDVPGARAMYQQALAAGTKNVKTLREMGHFEDRQNRLADAERYYSEAAKLAPQEPAVLNDLALCLARQGKAAPAAQVLGQAIRLAPTKPLYRNNMATVLMELGDQHEAMQHLLAAHPPATAFYNMGHLLEKGEKSEAAAAHYAEALRLDSTMKPAAAALARLTPAAEPNIPQTAMVSATVEPSFGPQSSWPSEPLAPRATAPPTSEPEFGPRLLPPID